MIIQILTRTRCAQCGGEGAIPDPTGFWTAFAQWWADYYAMYKADPPEAVREAFILGRGLNPAELPSELPSCAACGGSGFVEAWAEVDPFLAAMLKVPTPPEADVELATEAEEGPCS